jgi:hypothetical protein
MAARILFGLDRLPRTMDADDPRLPGVPATGGMLRLNTEPLPAAAQAELAGVGPAAQVAALRRWLDGQCGDYAAGRRRFVAVWLDWAARELAAHRAELAAALARFDGLYAPEDFLWSAPRPLPRAWLPGPDGPVFADLAFRTEDGPLAVLPGATAGGAALRAAGGAVWRIDPEVLAGGPAALAAVVPPSLGRFWSGERLPRSPFRRALAPPAGGSHRPS